MSKKSQAPKSSHITVIPSGEPPRTPFPSKYEGVVPTLKGLYGEMVKTDVKPEHFTDEDLRKWVKECRDSMPRETFAIDALCYWLGHFYPLYTPEGKEIADRMLHLE